MSEETYQTGRPIAPEAEKILGKTFSCLDHGFVRLVDYMGNDTAIVQAARVSYGKGTKKVSEDEGLIRYLMRNAHTTPFEMVNLKFHAKMPIFVARQWVRHRTASINEISGRYSVLDNEFYVPAPADIAIQSTKNRQGRGEVIDPNQSQAIISILTEEAQRDYANYQALLNEDLKNQGQQKDKSKPMLARELARMGLGLNFYTQWYWQANLHNLFHFLGLRKDKHAQKEIRVYADIMGNMAKAVAPMAYQAFEDYKLNALTLSAKDIQALREIKLKGVNPDEAATKVFTNKREREEFTGKLERLFGKS